jgi:hypothetical protein
MNEQIIGYSESFHVRQSYETIAKWWARKADDVLYFPHKTEGTYD